MTQEADAQWILDHPADRPLVWLKRWVVIQVKAHSLSFVDQAPFGFAATVGHPWPTM